MCKTTSLFTNKYGSIIDSLSIYSPHIPQHILTSKATERALLKLAVKARLYRGGLGSLYIPSRRAQRRAIGYNIYPGAPLPKALIRTLIAQGVRPDYAKAAYFGAPYMK